MRNERSSNESHECAHNGFGGCETPVPLEYFLTETDVRQQLLVSQ
jgi:hypothetical protein